jgi:hypothetical protein
VPQFNYINLNSSSFQGEKSLFDNLAFILGPLFQNATQLTQFTVCWQSPINNNTSSIASMMPTCQIKEKEHRLFAYENNKVMRLDQKEVTIVSSYL